MNYILVDNKTTLADFYPLTLTRPVGDLRIGILTLKEKWQKRLNDKVSFLCEDYLRKKFPSDIENDNIAISSNVLPFSQLVEAITKLEKGSALVYNNNIIAARLDAQDVITFYENRENLSLKTVEFNSEVLFINHTWDIFTYNEQEIERDFFLITAGRKSQPLNPTNRILQPERIFVEDGVTADFSIINPANGYVYLGKDSTVMENAVIHGSLALCEHSTVKISAKIYGASTFGPHSKVGGEVGNAVIWGYSNKGHDGFLGNAVLGQWCNLGADTNNSNLKNNYSEVKMWSYAKHRFIKTGLQFCGLVMGDHSKSSINTMFNTGTVVGVSANVFGAGFPRNFVPSFSWGGSAGYEEYPFKRAMETAALVMQRRNMPLTDIEIDILQNVFNKTSEYRNF